MHVCGLAGADHSSLDISAVGFSWRTGQPECPALRRGNKGHRLQAVTRNSSNEGLRHGVMVYVARMGKPCPEQRQQRQHSRASYRASNHDDHETATLDHAANAPKTLSTAYGSAGFARSTRRRLARFPIRRKPKPLQAIQAVSEAQRTEGQAGTDKPCAFRSMTANADG